MSKRQNTRQLISEGIQKIYRAGIFVNAGFIIGFDAEKASVAEGMVTCIEDTSIPVAMVGLLYALPNTQLYRRLESEGRLHPNADRALENDADQCTSGLNFDTGRPRRDMLEDYRIVLRRIYDPSAFFGRVSRMVQQLDLAQHKVNRPLRSLLREVRSFARITWRSGIRDRSVRGPFWRAVLECLAKKPRAVRVLYSQAALFLHFLPYSRLMDEKLTEKIDALPRTAGLSPRNPTPRRVVGGGVQREVST